MRMLLRAAADQDLFAEYSSLGEAFSAAGTEAQLRLRTRHSARAWELARRTGSSRPDGQGGFDDQGLVVCALAGGRRWLPRGGLADYLQALQDEDLERQLALSQSPETLDRHARPA